MTGEYYIGRDQKNTIDRRMKKTNRIEFDLSSDFFHHCWTNRKKMRKKCVRFRCVTHGHACSNNISGCQLVAFVHRFNLMQFWFNAIIHERANARIVYAKYRWTKKKWIINIGEKREWQPHQKCASPRKIVDVHEKGMNSHWQTYASVWFDMWRVTGWHIQIPLVTHASNLFVQSSPEMRQRKKTPARSVRNSVILSRFQFYAYEFSYPCRHNWRRRLQPARLWNKEHPLVRAGGCVAHFHPNNCIPQNSRRT